MSPLEFEIAQRLVRLLNGAEGSAQSWLEAKLKEYASLISEYLQLPEIILWQLGEVVIVHLPRREGKGHCRQPLMATAWKLVNEPWRPLSTLPAHWGLGREAA